MERWNFCFCMAVVILVLSFGGVTLADDSRVIHTPEELVRFVAEANQYIKTYGIESGLEEFSHSSSQFTLKNSYISVYDMEGILRAHPFLQDSIGTSRLNMTDPHGMEEIRLGRDIAKKGGGFFLYMGSIPETLNMSESSGDSLIPILGYVYPIDDQFWIESEINLTDLKNQQTGEPSLLPLESFVHKAAQYAREVGREKSIQEFNDLNGTFTNGSWYIYAFDMNGTFLASPYYPESIGTNQMDVVRDYGVASVAECIQIARNESSGFEAFVILNPDTNLSESKLGYVERIDDTWLVGSGWYVTDLVRSLSPGYNLTN